MKISINSALDGEEKNVRSRMVEKNILVNTPVSTGSQTGHVRRYTRVLQVPSLYILDACTRCSGRE